MTVELLKGSLHTVFPIDDASRIGEARRHASLLALHAGLDETSAGRVAIVVTELGTNLLRHAKHGQLLIAARDGEVETIAIDRGPGIADVQRSLGDGYSTGGTSGTGLGAVKRLSQAFEIHSTPGEGTVVVARVRASAANAPARSGMRCAGISISAPGEIVCGDGWSAGLNAKSATLMVADGLGHGGPAAEAAGAAMEVFAKEPAAAPRELMERAHVRLRATRGAAVTIVHADAGQGRLRACGAGNVLTRVVSGAVDRTVLTQHGTVGLQIRRIEQTEIEWPAHAIVVMHSDGIESRWDSRRLLPVLGRDPALAAAILVRDHCRGRDDATVVVLGRED